MTGDEHLIEVVAAGDGRALKELLRRHAPWVAARLRRTMPAHGVEDALQETFIAVWRGAEGYRADSAPGAWIWGIARRQAALWARKNGRPEPILEQAQETEDPAVAAAGSVDLERAWIGVAAEAYSSEPGPLEKLAGRLLPSPGLARALVNTPSLLFSWVIASAAILAAGASRPLSPATRGSGSSPRRSWASVSPSPTGPA